MIGALPTGEADAFRLASVLLALTVVFAQAGNLCVAQPTYDTNVMPNGAPSGASASNTTEQDPQFYNPAGADGTLGTIDDDYRPDKPAGSPLVDFAAGSYVTSGAAINGQAQTESGWDAGAFEASGSALPVELSAFDATLSEGQVRLTWATASETGNAAFAVERRETKENQWTAIGRVEGAGTTSRGRSYELVDEAPPTADTLAYRLRQIDTDGSETFTDPVRVVQDAPSTLSLKAPMPNPAAAQAIVRTAVPEQANGATLVVYDLLGRALWSTSVSPGRSALQVPASELATGTYVVRLETGQGIATARLTVVR